MVLTAAQWLIFRMGTTHWETSAALSVTSISLCVTFCALCGSRRLDAAYLSLKGSWDSLTWMHKSRCMAQVLHLYSVKKQHKHILYLFTARELFSESHLHQKKNRKNSALLLSRESVGVRKEDRKFRNRFSPPGPNWHNRCSLGKLAAAAAAAAGPISFFAQQKMLLVKHFKIIYC